MKKKSKKIEVSWAFGNPAYYQIEFGRFEAHQSNKIMVDEDFWSKYCDVRFEFEVMQKELMEKTSERGREKSSSPKVKI